MVRPNCREQFGTPAGRPRRGEAQDAPSNPTLSANLCQHPQTKHHNLGEYFSCRSRRGCCRGGKQPQRKDRENAQGSSHTPERGVFVEIKAPGVNEEGVYMPVHDRRVHPRQRRDRRNKPAQDVVRPNRREQFGTPAGRPLKEQKKTQYKKAVSAESIPIFNNPQNHLTPIWKTTQTHYTNKLSTIACKQGIITNIIHARHEP